MLMKFEYIIILKNLIALIIIARTSTLISEPQSFSYPSNETFKILNKKSNKSIAQQSISDIRIPKRPKASVTLYL